VIRRAAPEARGEVSRKGLFCGQPGEPLGGRSGATGVERPAIGLSRADRTIPGGVRIGFMLTRDAARSMAYPRVGMILCLSAPAGVTFEAGNRSFG
jgi:hypothetical protein